MQLLYRRGFAISKALGKIGNVVSFNEIRILLFAILAKVVAYHKKDYGSLPPSGIRIDYLHRYLEK